MCDLPCLRVQCWWHRCSCSQASQSYGAARFGWGPPGESYTEREVEHAICIVLQATKPCQTWGTWQGVKNGPDRLSDMGVMSSLLLWAHSKKGDYSGTTGSCNGWTLSPPCPTLMHNSTVMLGMPPFLFYIWTGKIVKIIWLVLKEKR